MRPVRSSFTARTRRDALIGGVAFACSSAAVAQTSSHGLDDAAIAAMVEDEIAAGRIPGAVLLVSENDVVVYRRAFGRRVLGAHPIAMTETTMFDLASLTKPIATASAIMTLVDTGAIELDASASRYWPDFARSGKAAITIRQLLTHYSGLPADMDVSRGWDGYEPAMAMICAMAPQAAPDSTYIYSDVGYLALGEIVQRVSGMAFDAYCATHIFSPLQMRDTQFLPANLKRVAPTQDIPGYPHWGDTHDATTRWMGGVSGSAGLFSTADDLARFMAMLLNGGALGATRVFSEGAARVLTTPQSPAGATHARAFGWDVGGPSGFPLFPDHSFGHLGYTGGMVWAHTQARVCVVALTHRVYPDGRGDADPLRRRLMPLITPLWA